MTKQDQLQFVLDHKLVAVVRSSDPDRLVEVARALRDGGIPIVEFTMTVPGALEVVRKVRDTLGEDLLLGVGTVLDPQTARAAFLAGAEYIVSPTVNFEVIRLCQKYGKLVIPGAFTPTEVLAAWEAGADIVKVFPADVGGPAYLKALRTPLPQIRLMPTGGVNLQTAVEFLRAGACCLGLGSSLIDQKALAEGNMDRIRILAEQFVELVGEEGGRGKEMTNVQ